MGEQRLDECKENIIVIVKKNREKQELTVEDNLIFVAVVKKKVVTIFE